MKIVKIDSTVSRTELLGIIKDSERVNERVRFDEKKGRPRMHVREKGDRLHIKCELVGGPTKDNGFLEGTYFVGKLSENDGVSRLRGVILTAPIYHSILAAILAIYVIRCISLSAFNPVPIILLLFSLLLFKTEFEKQGMIERYLKRAVRKSEENTRK